MDHPPWQGEVFTVAIQATLRKITKHYDKTADSDAFILTMGLFNLALLH